MMTARIVSTCILAFMALAMLPILCDAGRVLWRHGGVSNKASLVLSLLCTVALLATGFTVIWTH